MVAYYNEIDSYAAQWLRNLIGRGLIAHGDVDERRSIVDVSPHDLRGYHQCHFFAGIAGWSHALRLAGWPDDRPVWTGSCPCQPFSAAGQRTGGKDERHLWPHWFRLIRECRPSVIFGENVAAAIGWGWLDAVLADLEAEGYATGSAVLGAHSVGAPHIRQRVWFMADARRECVQYERRQLSGTAQADQGERHQREWIRPDAGNGESAGDLADCERTGLEVECVEPARDQCTTAERGGKAHPWNDCIWLPCADGKVRPVKSGIQPLAHGVSARMGKLRAAGNAIVPQVAAEFIKCVNEAAQQNKRQKMED